MAAVERLHAGGFDVAELTVGAASIKLNRARSEAPDRDDKPAPEGVYQTFGKEVMRQMQDILPGVDLQPAIGRAG